MSRWLWLLVLLLPGPVQAEPRWTVEASQLRAYGASQAQGTEVFAECPSAVIKLQLKGPSGRSTVPHPGTPCRLFVGKDLGHYLLPAGPAMQVPEGAIQAQETPLSGWVEWKFQGRSISLHWDLHFPSRQVRLNPIVVVPVWPYPP